MHDILHRPPTRLPAVAAHGWRRHIGVVAAIALAGVAVLWLWTSLVTIANFALRYPAFDQYRLYPNYLRLPFPANILQSENLHHPVVPNLIRLADLYWTAASQRLQVGCGIAAALLILTLVVITIARESELSALRRSAACLVAVLAIFWLGNARTLMHGFESVHVYFAMLGAVVAVLAIESTRRTDSVRTTALAAAACVVATFTYGAGMASFVAAGMLAVVLGLRRRHLVLLAATAVIALTIYLFVLPGDDAVRSGLSFDPLATATALARWLSAPWMRAWFGSADPTFDPALTRTLGDSVGGRLMLLSAHAISVPFGASPVMRESALIGFAGLLAYVVVLVHALRAGAAISRLRAFGLGLATFGVATAGIVCLGRLGYFAELPAQLFADRYSPWPCAFWLGLGLYAICLWRSSTLATCATAAGACALALMLVPSNQTWAGWSAAVFRNLQQSTTAIQLGIWDPQRIFDVWDKRPDVTIDTLDLLREHRLSMYAEPAFDVVVHGWQAPASVPRPLASARARFVRRFDDTRGHREVLAFEGWMPKVEHLPRDAVLVVTDASGRLRGLAKFGFIGSGAGSVRWKRERMLGFDGYVTDPRADDVLQILVLGSDLTTVLATIPLPQTGTLP